MAGTFYLGPLGGMVPLPVPQAGVQRPVERIGGIHVSRNGSKTVDSFGMKRSWSLAFDWRFQSELEAIRLMHYGATAGALRIIDPMVLNRLPAEIASTGSVRYDGVLVAHEVQGSAQLVSEWPSGASKVPLSSSIAWTPPDTGGELTSSDPAYAIPVLEGEAVTASAYVRSPDGRSAQVALRSYSATGAVNATTTGAITTSASWQRLTVSYTPTATDAAVAVVLTSVASTGVIRTAAWQLEVGETATDWMLGGGCPEVVIDQMPEESPYFPMTDAGLTLLEV
ncbi:phage head spike fiber domain-containing protein [Saccharopolyspora taberi]|uniref:Minor tail protein n=1 Tax=Saccharopolyspora taberi TaxID=60895 RepID=A0ABN3V0U5_9PSEU